MSDFSVVIVTYNSAQTIDACLGSVLATLGPDDELFVIDNASQDDTASRIRSWASRDGRIRPHYSDTNLGFSEGTNVGLRQATGDYQVMLNPDTYVTQGWLQRLRAYFDDEEVGAVGPIATYSIRDQLASTYFPVEEIVGHPVEEVAARIAEANKGKGRSTKLLIGFCVMLPKRVLDQVGLLDSELFLGMDDLDLSWRLREAGYRLLIATDTYIVHEGQVSFKTRPKAETQVLVQAGTDYLAQKLEKYYGPGNVPSVDELWGPIPWFKPSFDLWGSRSTVFRVLEDGPCEEAEAAFKEAFEDEEGEEAEVTFEIVEATGGDDAQTEDRQIVWIAQGSTAPWHLPEVSSELMRQAAGLRVAPRTEGLTSIIILTLNQIRFTRECLASLYEFTPEPFELIVVDNGSTDETRAFLKDFAERNPNVKLVFNDKNLGFAGGCNQGLALARGEYLLLLNNDVVLTEGWLTKMRRPMERDPSIGIVGPRSNKVSGEQILLDATYQSVGELHQYARNRSRKHAGQGHHAPMVVGFVLLMPARLVAEIGGLDTRFGTGNFEDDDFCYRAQLAGWKIWVADDVFIHHYGSRTFIGERVDYTASIDKNKVIFREKWNIEPFETRTELDAMIGALTGKVGPELLFSALPDPATVPMVIEKIAVEGLKTCNLLLDADWSGRPDDWIWAVEAFAQAFKASEPATLVMAGASGDALERVSAILEAQGEGAPDVLCLEPEYAGAAGLIRVCQGVVAAHPAREAEVRDLARICGRPVFTDLTSSVLIEWFDRCVEPCASASG